MKNNSKPLTFSVLAVALFSFSFFSTAFASDELSKLKELERAMAAPAVDIVQKKPRTRAIVFDGDQTSSPAVQGAATPTAKVNTAIDCNALPPDVRVIPVDFSIQFKIGSAEIAPTSELTLREISKILSLNPERCVLIEGHTDITGNFERNMSLSQDRANSVVTFIVDKTNINRNRLIPIGKGSSEPVKNLDPRDQKNRRVVFKVVG